MWMNSKIYWKIWWPIARWLKGSHLVYIESLNFKKLYWPWYEAKEYFLRPRMECYRMHPATWCIFKLYVVPLGWKTKYDDYRHEENPYIVIECLNKAWRIVFRAPGLDELGKDCDLQYYETILTFLYDKRFNGNLKEVFEYCNAWTTSNHDGYLTCNSCLTQKGASQVHPS